MKLKNCLDWLEIAVVFTWFITGWSPNLLHHKEVDKLISGVTVTAYRPEKQFTDSTPNWTSIGHPAVMGIVAASRDLLKDGRLQYGSVVQIPGFGVYLVADTMNQRHTNHLDILVYTKTQERLVGWRKNVTVRVLSHESP